MPYRRRTYRRNYRRPNYRRRNYRPRPNRKKRYIYSKQSRKTLPNYRKATVTKNFADLRKSKTALPNTIMNTMAYQDYIQTNQSNVVDIRHVWRANSLNDVDQTGTGSQPPMYDDMYTLYDFSSVKTANVKIRINNKNDRAFRMFLVCQLDTTTYSDQTTYMLQNHPGFLRYVDVGPADVESAQHTISAKIDIYSMYRKLNQPNELGNSLTNLQASVNNNPTSPLYLMMYIQYFDEDVTGTAIYDYSIDWHFDTLWFRKKVPAAIQYD
jgi:hypothetical protein